MKNPDSYHWITVASNLGKLVEKEMMNRSEPATKAQQDPVQFGFTAGCSPSTRALLITEAIAEAKDNSSQLYITLLDSNKAFDMVDHTALLTALYYLGIEPNLWHLYIDMYTDIASRVLVNGQLF